MSSFHPERTTKPIVEPKSLYIIGSAQSHKIKTPNSTIYERHISFYNTHPRWLKNKLTGQNEYPEATCCKTGPENNQTPLVINFSPHPFMCIINNLQPILD